MAGPNLDLDRICKGKKGNVRKGTCVAINFIITLILLILLTKFVYYNPD